MSVYAVIYICTGRVCILFNVSLWIWVWMDSAVTRDQNDCMDSQVNMSIWNTVIRHNKPWIMVNGRNYRWNTAILNNTIVIFLCNHNYSTAWVVMALLFFGHQPQWKSFSSFFLNRIFGIEPCICRWIQIVDYRLNLAFLFLFNC